MHVKQKILEICAVIFNYFYHVINDLRYLLSLFFPADQKKASVTAEVAAEAEKETDAETETGIERRTGREGTDLDRVQDPDLAPETETGTEVVAREETDLPVGLIAHPAPERTKTKMLTAGKTNMWIALLQRSLLWATSTTER